MGKQLKKINRTEEIGLLKEGIKENLKKIGMSRREFMMIPLRVKGRKKPEYDYEYDVTGQKPSLKQQYTRTVELLNDWKEKQRWLEEERSKLMEKNIKEGNHDTKK